MLSHRRRCQHNLLRGCKVHVCRCQRPWHLNTHRLRQSCRRSHMHIRARAGSRGRGLDLPGMQLDLASVRSKVTQILYLCNIDSFCYLSYYIHARPRARLTEGRSWSSAPTARCAVTAILDGEHAPRSKCCAVEWNTAAEEVHVRL